MFDNKTILLITVIKLNDIIVWDNFIVIELLLWLLRKLQMIIMWKCYNEP